MTQEECSCQNMLGMPLQDQDLQPFAAALVSMAGLGPSKAQYILQLPPDSSITEQHQQDALQSAVNLHNSSYDRNRVVGVNAMESIREARTQCAVCPGIAEFYTNLFCHGDHDEVCPSTLVPWIPGAHSVATLRCAVYSSMSRASPCVFAGPFQQLLLASSCIM